MEGVKRRLSAEPKAVARFYGGRVVRTRTLLSAYQGYCGGQGGTLRPVSGRPDLQCEEDLLRSVEIANPVSQRVAL